MNEIYNNKEYDALDYESSGDEDESSGSSSDEGLSDEASKALTFKAIIIMKYNCLLLF